MDINQITEGIKEKCRLNNYPEIEKEIDKRIRAGSTGSEILLMVGKYLADLKKTKKDLFDLIKIEVEAYLKYCTAHGLTIS